MKIWPSFQLHGTVYTVTIYSEGKWIGEADEYGFINPQLCSVGIKKAPHQVMELTLCHELVHGILNAMGEVDLYKNEKFVESFSGLLHQALNSSAYK